MLNKILKRFFQTFNRKDLYFIYAIFIGVFFFSLLGINGSSIGVYNSFLNGDTKNDSLILGSPRSIRSDEWMVSTPLTVSQSNTNFSQTNNLIGTGEELSVIYDAPTNHWTTIFKPYNWSFFVMPIENAFAFKWWIRGAFVVISIYLFLLFITKKNYFLSIGGSLIIFFSPFLQWWYSTAALESIAYLFFSLFFALKLFHYKNKKELIIYTLLAAFFSVAFIIVLYPPFQIPLALGGLFFLAGHIIDNRKSLNKKRIRDLAISIVSLGVIIGAAMFGYFESFKDVIKAIQSTSYPGQRVVVGGDYPWSRLLIGPYNFIFQSKGLEVPAFMGNKSESSSFIMPYLFLLPMTIYISIYKFIKEKKINFTLVLQIIFLLLITIWIIVGLPAIIARITLLNLVPQNRAIIGIGIFGIIFVIYFLSSIDIKNIKLYKPLSYIFIAGCAITYFFVAKFFKSDYPSFISSKYLIVGALAIIIIVSLIIKRKNKLFIIAALGFCILSTIFINPVYSGLKPLNNSMLKNDLASIDNQTKSARWVMFEKDMNLNDFLASNGFDTLNGVHLYPEFQMWEKLDPEKKYYEQYNRYAHVTFQASNADELTIENPYPDVTLVKINPCDNKLDDLNVKYFVFSDKTDAYSCLNFVKTVDFPNVDLNVYKKN